MFKISWKKKKGILVAFIKVGRAHCCISYVVSNNILYQILMQSSCCPVLYLVHVSGRLLIL